MRVCFLAVLTVVVGIPSIAGAAGTSATIANDGSSATIVIQDQDAVSLFRSLLVPAVDLGDGILGKSYSTPRSQFSVTCQSTPALGTASCALMVTAHEFSTIQPQRGMVSYVVDGKIARDLFSSFAHSEDTFLFVSSDRKLTLTAYYFEFILNYVSFIPAK